MIFLKSLPSYNANDMNGFFSLFLYLRSGISDLHFRGNTLQYIKKIIVNIRCWLWTKIGRF